MVQAIRFLQLLDDPGAPWQNGYAESFNSRFRDELLNAELFADLREAKGLSMMWRNDYNHRRPHSSLGYVTPAEFELVERSSVDNDPNLRMKLNITVTTPD